MCNEKLYADLFNICENDSISKMDLLKLLKYYSSQISVFELMNMISYSDSTFEGVSEKWKKLGNEMQVRTFLDRIKRLNTDNKEYLGSIDSDEFKYILEEPIHPEGSQFLGSGKVFKKDGEFYCPARDANDDNLKAFCRLCMCRGFEF